MVAPLAGIVLGSAALRRIRSARGALGGRRIALAGTFLGALVLIVQLGLLVAGAERLHRYVQREIVLAANGFIEAASDGDLARARGFCLTSGSAQPRADDIAAFGAEVRRRYGRLLEFRVVNEVQSGSALEQYREVAAYFRFEGGERSGWARFAILAGQTSLLPVARLEKLVIEDPEQGDMVFSATPQQSGSPGESGKPTEQASAGSKGAAAPQ